MSAFTENWGRPIAQGVVATAICGAITWLAVRLAIMTAIITLFAPLSYLFVALIAFALSMCCVGLWRKFWKPAPLIPALTPIVYDDSELRAIVDSNTEILAAFAGDAQAMNKRLAGIETLNREIIDDYQRMLGVEARLCGEIDGVKTVIQAESKRVGDHFAVSDRKLAEETQLNVDRYERTFVSIRAIFDREMLHRRSIRIEDAAEALRSQFADGAVLTADQWTIWLREKLSWRAEMLAWAEIAERYTPGALDKIEHLPLDFAAGPWTVSTKQFPFDGGLSEFQIFAVQDRKWCDAARLVADRVMRVAFEGA